MKNNLYCLLVALLLAIGVHHSTIAQKRHAVYAADLDGDGVPDTGGQDKCPTTLTQIKGKRATAKDEISGKEVVIRLPEKLEDYVFQDRAPLDEEKKKLLNKQGEYKREFKRADEKYGRYGEMKSRDRKAEMEKFDSLITAYQAKIDSMAQKILSVDPNSYIEFKGNLEDKDGNVIQENITVRIRINVDAFGCLQDDDRDGSPNMVDLCPGVMGTMEASGCPDRDRDGIPDKEDDCPDVKGVKYARGCPDRDKDTVPDKTDKCPDTPGLVELNGCPDRDKDGVADATDECPDTPGLADLKGCPDRDKDGIADKNDDCPDNPGPVETRGCPDRDRDGVLDREDDCPDVPGPKDNKGCPKILEKASKVQFKVNEAIILPVSYSLLDELVALLKEYPDANIALAGHTDGDGSDEDNLRLSTNRAAAVKDYLINKGIAAERITSTGYGERQPIADNATPEGKAKNRRVEMKLSNKK